MYEFAGVIQRIVQDRVAAMKPADMATGTVVCASPLSIQPDTSMPPLPAAALELTDTVKERVVPVRGGDGTVTVREGLGAGDKVLMLRVQGGNRYIVLSKLT